MNIPGRAQGQFASGRYVTRSLRPNPGFIALEVLIIMALDIGANTAVFDVVNTVLLKPLAYRDPDRIVSLTNPVTPGEVSSPLAVKLVAVPNFQDWHDRSSSFEAIAFYYAWENPVMLGLSSCNGFPACSDIGGLLCSSTSGGQNRPAECTKTGVDSSRSARRW
jgi:hypothetical protein